MSSALSITCSFKNRVHWVAELNGLILLLSRNCETYSTSYKQPFNNYQKVVENKCKTANQMLFFQELYQVMLYSHTIPIIQLKVIGPQYTQLDNNIFSYFSHYLEHTLTTKHKCGKILAVAQSPKQIIYCKCYC